MVKNGIYLTRGESRRRQSYPNVGAKCRRKFRPTLPYVIMAAIILWSIVGAADQRFLRSTSADSLALSLRLSR
jgi:hypothetical protein